MSSNNPSRVLVIDDDDGVRETVAALLTYEGYAVSTARDGAEGLQALERDSLPDAIILDLMMPGVDGWEFRERQLASRAAALPTIIFSAARGSLPRPRPELEGCAFLSKPFDIDDLVKVVGECITTSSRG